MNHAGAHEKLKPQPGSAGGPPPPPKKAARGLHDESPDEPHIDLPDPVVVKDLAAALRQKPFKIIADLLEFGRFASVGDTVDFGTAARVARRRGFRARRIG